MLLPNVPIIDIVLVTETYVLILHFGQFTAFCPLMQHTCMLVMFTFDADVRGLDRLRFAACPLLLELFPPRWSSVVDAVGAMMFRVETGASMEMLC